MPQHNRRSMHSKYVWGLIIALGSVVVALVVVVLGSRSVNNAPTTSTRPRPTPVTSVSIVVSPTAASTPASHPTQWIPVLVRAYTIEGRMADGLPCLPPGSSPSSWSKNQETTTRRRRPCCCL